MWTEKSNRTRPSALLTPSTPTRSGLPCPTSSTATRGRAKRTPKSTQPPDNSPKVESAFANKRHSPMSTLRGFVCEMTLNCRLILAGSISPTGGWFDPPPDTQFRQVLESAPTCTLYVSSATKMFPAPLESGLNHPSYGFPVIRKLRLNYGRTRAAFRD